MNLTSEVALNLNDMRLSQRQRKFVINFRGIPEDACDAAGYTKNNGSHQHTIKRLMSNPAIIAAIRRRDELMEAMPFESDPCLNLDQLRRWWTTVVLDQNNKTADRIACSKLLAQSYGSFLEKVTLNQVNQNRVINIKIASPLPTNENDRLEVERLQKAIEVQTSNELTAMNKKERRLISRPVNIDDVL